MCLCYLGLFVLAGLAVLAALLVLVGLFMLPCVFVVPPPFILPPFMLPPVFAGGIGVIVLVGVGVVVETLVEFVVVVLLVLSLPQPIPRAARASKVRRAKVLRIELSPVTQRVSLLGSFSPKARAVLCKLDSGFSSVKGLSRLASALCHEKCGREPNAQGQVNSSQSRMSAVNTFIRRTNLLGVRVTPMILKARLISNHFMPFPVKPSCLIFNTARAGTAPTERRF